MKGPLIQVGVSPATLAELRRAPIKIHKQPPAYVGAWGASLDAWLGLKVANHLSKAVKVRYVTITGCSLTAKTDAARRQR